MMFPPAFLDSSCFWNTSHNQLQMQQLASNSITTTPSPAAGDGGGGANNNHHPDPQDTSMATATGGGGGGGGVEGDGDGGPNKPMSMSERARLARVPQPEPGLNCPRCDSTNTKFCYFNNYSLTQPRHFCSACRCYWTRGGALRNVPVCGGYRRHAKRSTKPKASAGAATAAGTSSATSTTPSSATTCTGSATAGVQPRMQYSMFINSAPTHGRFADGFDPASLGLSFPTRLLFGDGNGAYATDGGVHHGHQGTGNGMEQWASMAQMQGFPFLHAMDHQMAGNPPPTTMAAMQGMFQLGLQSGGCRSNGEDGRDHQFHHHEMPQAKRNHQQQQEGELQYGFQLRFDDIIRSRFQSTQNYQLIKLIPSLLESLADSLLRNCVWVGIAAYTAKKVTEKDFAGIREELQKKADMNDISRIREELQKKVDEKEISRIREELQRLQTSNAVLSRYFIDLQDERSRLKQQPLAMTAADIPVQDTAPLPLPCLYGPAGEETGRGGGYWAGSWAQLEKESARPAENHEN